MKLRIVSWIILFLLALLLPFPLFLFASFLYIILFPGYELLIIGVFVDAVFGFGNTTYLYTLTLGLLLFLGIVLKPYFSWYKEEAV